MIKVKNENYRVGDTVVTRKRDGFYVASKPIFAREKIYTNVYSVCVSVDGDMAELKPFKEEPVYLEF